MGTLLTYVTKRVKLRSIHSVVLDELKEGEKNLLKLKASFAAANGDEKKRRKLIKDCGFKEDECRFVLNNIRSDIKKAESLAAKHDAAVACFGDKVLCAVYGRGCGKKVIDVLAVMKPVRCKDSGWFLAECKFEVKTQVGGPFSDEDNFGETVDRKFGRIQKKLTGDGEPFSDERLVLVVSHELQKCIRHLEGLKHGSTGKKFDWSKYKLCTVDDVFKLYKLAEKRFAKERSRA